MESKKFWMIAGAQPYYILRFIFIILWYVAVSYQIKIFYFWMEAS